MYITIKKAAEILGFSLVYTEALLKAGDLNGDDGLVLESSVHDWMKKHDVHFPLTEDEKALLEKPTPPEFFDD